jgi:hypothetical protein
VVSPSLTGQEQGTLFDQRKGADKAERIRIRWDGSGGQAAAESLAVNVLPTSRPASLRYPKWAADSSVQAGFHMIT